MWERNTVGSHFRLLATVVYAEGSGAGSRLDVCGRRLHFCRWCADGVAQVRCDFALTDRSRPFRRRPSSHRRGWACVEALLNRVRCKPVPPASTASRWRAWKADRSEVTARDRQPKPPIMRSSCVTFALRSEIRCAAYLLELVMPPRLGREV